MEMLRNGTVTAAMLAAVMAFVLLRQVSSTRITVGGANVGWNTNVNFTAWAQNQTFYNDDWLYFVYDRNQMNVLEVNKTDYEACNSDHFLHNWSTGAGRDVVHLNETRPYYFISGKGFCWGGMKLEIHVQNRPPPPPPPKKNDSPSANPSILGLLVATVVFGIMINWDSFLIRFF